MTDIKPIDFFLMEQKRIILRRDKWGHIRYRLNRENEKLNPLVKMHFFVRADMAFLLKTCSLSYQRCFLWDIFSPSSNFTVSFSILRP